MQHLTSPIPAPGPALPYADLPARWGVSVEKGPASIRVTVPPVPSWRHLGIGFHVGIAILSSILGGWCIGVAVGGAPPEVLIPQFVVYGVPLLIVLAVALERLHRRIVVAISGSAVSLGVLTPRGTARWVSWPRPKVSEIKINGVNGKLLFRVQGADLVERYLGPNAQLNRFVADTLAAALRDLPVSSGPSWTDDAAPQPDPQSTRRWRRLMFGAGIAMFAGGVVLILLPFPAGVIGLYVLLASCIPFGIIYGTQDKEFYA